jgi:transposase
VPKAPSRGQLHQARRIETLVLCKAPHKRKNWLFLGNDRGGRTAAILLSFMASCKANQVEPWAYIRAMISELAKQPRGETPSPSLLASLLPDAWLAAHPEARRPWFR